MPTGQTTNQQDNNLSDENQRKARLLSSQMASIKQKKEKKLMKEAKGMVTVMGTMAKMAESADKNKKALENKKLGQQSGSLDLMDEETDGSVGNDATKEAELKQNQQQDRINPEGNQNRDKDDDKKDEDKKDDDKKDEEAEQKKQQQTPPPSQQPQQQGQQPQQNQQSEEQQNPNENKDENKNPEEENEEEEPKEKESERLRREAQEKEETGKMLDQARASVLKAKMRMAQIKEMKEAAEDAVEMAKAKVKEAVNMVRKSIDMILSTSPVASPWCMVKLGASFRNSFPPSSKHRERPLFIINPMTYQTWNPAKPIKAKWPLLPL
ncbi:MAG: hypothetical protein ABIH21_05050, partial [Patescibacteria group bacterium]